MLVATPAWINITTRNLTACGYKLTLFSQIYVEEAHLSISALQPPLIESSDNGQMAELKVSTNTMIEPALKIYIVVRFQPAYPQNQGQEVGSLAASRLAFSLGTQ